jgi:hypothetical protein
MANDTPTNTGEIAAVNVLSLDAKTQ